MLVWRLKSVKLNAHLFWVCVHAIMHACTHVCALRCATWYSLSCSTTRRNDIVHQVLWPLQYYPPAHRGRCIPLLVSGREGGAGADRQMVLMWDICLYPTGYFKYDTLVIWMLPQACSRNNKTQHTSTDCVLHTTLNDGLITTLRVSYV